MELNSVRVDPGYCQGATPTSEWTVVQLPSKVVGDRRRRLPMLLEISGNDSRIDETIAESSTGRVAQAMQSKL